VVDPGVGPSGGTLLNSKIMCKRVHVGGVYIDIRKTEVGGPLISSANR
jgi:hypothetical protein